MDVFDLSATLRLDSSGYEQGLSDAEGRASSAGSKIKSGLATAAKITGAAFTAAATAVGFLTKAAVSGYGEQQQMVGGVQKLYGNMGMSVEQYAQSVGKSVDDVKDEWQRLEDAQNLVLDNARDAYKNSGMSMNQYMDTATSFSAALINSLGGDTVKAAEQTDVAMRAISDNFNTFGGDIGMIKGAFQGFAKQNYTMLDNLKLGYGGTKTEMERLISDANDYAKSMGMAGDLTIDSFSDVVTAIDLVQQKQGVAGTTAREAATTIQGSMGMLKGAWENLLAGLGDADADIDALVNNVVSSAETVLGNVMPVVGTTLNSISSLVTKAAPMIIGKLPGLVGEILPELITAATSLVVSLVAALPGIMQALVEAIPEIVSSILELDWSGIATQIVEAFISAYQSVLSMFDGVGLDTILAIVESIIASFESVLPMFNGIGLGTILTIADGMLTNAESLVLTAGNILNNLLQSFMTYLPQWLSKGAEIIVKIANGITSRAPDILNTITTVMSNLISTIMKNFPTLLQKGADIVGRLASGIGKNIPALVSAIASALAKLIATIGQNLPQFLQKGLEVIGNILTGIIQAVPKILGAIPGILSQIASAFSGYDWLSIGSQIINGIANGIRNGASKVIEAAKNVAKDAFEKAKSFLGINSPSKLFREKIGKGITEGWALGIEDGEKDVVSSLNDLNEDMDADFGGMEDYDRSTTTVSVSGNRDRLEYKEVTSLLEAMLALLSDVDESMDDRLTAAFERMKLQVNGREFGRLVRDVRTA